MMKKKLLIIVIIFSTICSSFGQTSGKMSNTSFYYYSDPGFVNITELTGAPSIEIACCRNSLYYFGASSIFGYQFNRNLMCGAGTGFFVYEDNPLIPVFTSVRYTAYLEKFNPYFYADGGILMDFHDFNDGSKVFVNPGIGISRSITPKIEICIDAGISVQKGNSVCRATFVNFRSGLIFRKNATRLYKPPEKRNNRI